VRGKKIFQACSLPWCVTYGAVPTRKAQLRIAYGRSISHPVWYRAPPSRRSARSSRRWKVDRVGRAGRSSAWRQGPGANPAGLPVGRRGAQDAGR
jgi:hypothetical protein